jgi:hypothetical protein
MKRVSILFLVLFFWLSSDISAQQGTVELGTGTASNSTTTSPTPYGTWYKNLRQQYLVLASELSSIGLGAGDITAIGFNVANVNNCSPMPNYTMKIKTTTASFLIWDFDNADYTVVWTNPNFQPVAGWNTHTFNAPFYWDGTSNLLVDVCFDIISGYTQNASVYYTPTATNLSVHYINDSQIACGTTNPGIVSLNRANMQFTGVVTGCLPPTGIVAYDITNNSTLISWTPSGGASQWDLLYGASGFDPLSQGTLIEGITNPSYSLTGLAPTSSYQVYVRADCGTEVSLWGGPTAFTTLCDPVNLPYIANFDGAATGTFPTCWSKSGLGTTNWSISATAYALGAAPELRFTYSPSFTGEALAISPFINTTGETSVVIEFKHFFDYYAVPFTIGMKTTSNGIDWHTVWEVIDPTANVGPETVLLSVNNGDVGSPTFQFAFFVNGYTINVDNWWIDDIKVFAPTFGTLAGTVTEATTRGPITGALVTAGNYQATTDASGSYLIENMMSDTYDVTCEAEGYFPVTVEDVQILADQTTTQDFALGFATITVTPTNLIENLSPGETTNKTLTISNIGGTEPLIWSGSIENMEPSKANNFNEQQFGKTLFRNFPKSTHAESSLSGFSKISYDTDAYTTCPDGSILSQPVETVDWAVASSELDPDFTAYQYFTDLSAPIGGITFWGGNLIYAGDWSACDTEDPMTFAIKFYEDNAGIPGNEVASYLPTLARVSTGIPLGSYGDFYIYQFTFDQIVNLNNGWVSIVGQTASPNCWFMWASTSEPSAFPYLQWDGAEFSVGDYGLSMCLSEGQSWISMDITSGVINPGESQEINVTFDATGIVDSTYLANIKINHNGQEITDGTVIVPATLIVASTAPPLSPTDPMPISGATLVPRQPEFSWTNGNGTAQVRFTLNTGTPPFGNIIHTSPWFVGNSLNLADVGKTLEPKKTYYWTVQAKNAAGTTTSAKWSFTTIGTGTISGTVTDAYFALPIEGAAITVEPGGYSATTSITGTYSIAQVLEGDYTVTVEKNGYATDSVLVVVAHNQTTTASFALNQILDPPFLLHAQVVNIDDVHLDWQSPDAGFSEWLTYSGESIANSVGVDGPVDFDVAARFTPDMLTAFPSGSITKIQFVPSEPDLICTYTLKVWEGVSPPTLIYSQVLPSITEDIWNEVVLTTPVPFDNTKELWFGFNCNASAGHPAGCDDGPQVEGFGNMMFWGGEWTTLSIVGGANNLFYNWAVKGYVESAKGGAILEPIKEVRIISANQGTLILNPVAMKPTVSFTTDNNRALLSFNIYRNGTFLANTGQGITEYDDLNLVAGIYTYTVKAVYDQGESTAVGPKSVEILPPPVFISAEPNLFGVHLEWLEGIRDLSYFNVYRDGVDIADVYGHSYYDDVNIANGETYCYTVSEVPAPGLETPMSNQLCATIPMMPEIAVSPTSLTETHIIPPARITTQAVTLTNNGQGPLNWMLHVNNSAPADLEYCSASTQFEDEYISKVLCGAINNTSGWQSGVSNYTALSTTLEPGASEPIIVTNGKNTSGDKVTCWVDWNLDYTFGVGTNEEFILTTLDQGKTFTGAIVVPAATPGGDYRMRVRMNYSSAPAPCGMSNFGEIEDYTISVENIWLSADLLEGTLAPGTSTNITVSFNSEGLEAGIYSGTLEFMNNDPVTPVLIVPVEFTVEIAATGIIVGHVTDALSRGPVGYVLITADELLISTTADKNGYYELEVQPGNYLLTATKAGYITQTAEVTVAPDQITTQNFLLEFAAPVLLYANGGLDKINIEWTGNPAAPEDNVVRCSIADLEWNADKNNDTTSSGEFMVMITEETTCEVEIPEGSIPEGEPCIENGEIDVTNGGCLAAARLFTPISCGDVIWGTASTYITAGVQKSDQDWYEFTISESEEITFKVTAEFPVVIGIMEQIEPGVPGCDNLTLGLLTSAFAQPCEEAVVTATLTSGTHYLFLTIPAYVGDFSCGLSNNYVAKLKCGETFVPYYNVIRDGEVIAQTYLETYTDTDVLPDVEYCYTINEVIEPDVVTSESNELCASVCVAICEYTMVLTDSYGDGWNGASFTIMQDGAEIDTYTLASGAIATVVIPLCDAAETSFTWNSGMYDGENGFELFDPEGNSLYNFGFGGYPLNGVVFFTFSTACPASPSQEIILPLGWSAWSSYLTPAANVSDVMAPVVADMVITQHFNELFYPAFGINTMGTFSNNHGYITKMAAAAILTINGNMADPTVQLHTGWNLISVLQECSIPAADVFGGIAGFVIAWEPTGNGIYYPEYDIYTLTTLSPGKAYYVKVTEPSSFTYPGCDKSSGNMFSAPLRAANTTSWNDVAYTGVNHVVVFDSKATNNLRIGDMIGAFANGSVCAGLVEYTGANLGFTLFGDDFTTMANEGFTEGDVMTYKVFRAETGEEFTMDAVYSLDAPNSSTFVTNGLSVITDLKLAPLSIGENTLKNLSIYPNPSSGIFNIAVNGLDTQINYVVMNAQGQEIYNGNLLESQQLDLSNEAKGIYFIKFISDSVLRVEKLVVK